MNITEPDALPESVEPAAEPLQYRITEKPKPAIVLNRAQRRALAKYIRHTRTAQRSRQAQRASDETRGCPRCGKYFFVPSVFAAMPGVVVPRCQCQALSHHQCAMCGAAFMASQQEWHRSNVCPGCAEKIRVQRENEAASAAEAQQRYYDLRTWDDEQHREAQERAEVIG